MKPLSTRTLYFSRAAAIIFFRVVVLIAVLAIPWITVSSQGALPAAPMVEVAPLAPDLPVFNLHLSDASGKTYIPNGPVPIKVRFSGAVTDERTFTLSPGHPSAAFELPESVAGKVHFSASDSQNPQRFLPGDTQFDFLQPKPTSGNLKIVLAFFPSTSFFLVGSEATLVARLLGDDGNPVASPVALKISFPGVENNLKPPNIEIGRNKSFGEARLTSDTPAKLALRPSVDPLVVAGRPVQPEAKDVEFLPPPDRAGVEPEQASLSSGLFGTSSTLVSVVLYSNKNLVDSNGVREVLLTVDPPQRGRLAQSRLLIQPGSNSVTTTYTPIQDGKATIAASVAGLPRAEADVVFDYPWYGAELIWLVMVAGFIGAVLKATEQTKLQKKDVSVVDFFKKFLLFGLLGAYLAFLFGTTLLRTDFQQALLQSGSRQLVSFYWGLFGGYLGPLVIVSSLVPKHDDA
jgi:hypothetical protein